MTPDPTKWPFPLTPPNPVGKPAPRRKDDCDDMEDAPW
jgi:hypothetical protein